MATRKQVLPHAKRLANDTTVKGEGGAQKQAIPKKLNLIRLANDVIRGKGLGVLKNTLCVPPPPLQSYTIRYIRYERCGLVFLRFYLTIKIVHNCNRKLQSSIRFLAQQPLLLGRMWNAWSSTPEHAQQYFQKRSTGSLKPG